MTSIKILASPRTALFSDLHPFFRWKKQLSEQNIHVSIYFDHKKLKISEHDHLILHHRYFESGWRDFSKPMSENDKTVIHYLKEVRKKGCRILWWDAQDTSGSTGFPVIPYVDTFIKNQVLKDKTYYTSVNNRPNLRVWLDPEIEQTVFVPCPSDQLHKIKVGWNLAFNDRRYFPFKLHYYFSNITSYRINPLKFTNVDAERPLDLTFRGKANYDNKFPQHNAISFQRNEVFRLLESMKFNVTYGNVVSRKQYLRELSQSKISISPFGYGEVCYRDFETFIAGSILIKPSMEHLITFPNLFLPNETYIPVSWDLHDLQEKAEFVIANYNMHKEIAKNGQEAYRNFINSPDIFISSVKNLINQNGQS
ncbi:glycosyltransferase family 1 protein [Flavihumibacter sp. R14]|nr:glycosyltransferase family 1 protein [Flavihumibacter soli]